MCNVSGDSIEKEVVMRICWNFSQLLITPSTLKNQNKNRGSPCLISRYRAEVLNVKKILAVINATYAVAKRKPEKIRLAGIRTLTSAIPVQRSNQLS